MTSYLLKKKHQEKYLQRDQMNFIQNKRMFIFTKDPIRGCARTFQSAEEARKYNWEHRLNCTIVPKYQSWKNTEPYLHY